MHNDGKTLKYEWIVKIAERVEMAQLICFIRDKTTSGSQFGAVAKALKLGRYEF